MWWESRLGTFFCTPLCVSSCNRVLAPPWQILTEPLMWAGYQLHALLLNLGGRWKRRESEAQSDSLMKSLLLSQITVKIVVLLLPCYSISSKLFHLSGPCLLICKLGGWLSHLLVTRRVSDSRCCFNRFTLWRWHCPCHPRWHPSLGLVTYSKTWGGFQDWIVRLFIPNGDLTLSE